MICHRPGDKGIGICCLSPLYFDFLTGEEAAEQMDMRGEGVSEEGREVSAESEDDFLAELGL